MIFWKARWFPIFLALLFQLGVAADADAYALSGHKWPDGTQILIHLGLDRAQIPLQDGSATWNDSAADALAIWNQYIPKVMFVTAGEVAPGDGDGVNTAFFANNYYGTSFGSNVLAITIRHWNGANSITETDVIFDNQRNWDSYRGPLQGSGPNGLYDFHRVALHEFGHVLGLDHPDNVGQSVVAIMNSIISDLDQLADDDIAGVWSLYGYKITSEIYPQYTTSGQQFTYQIKTDGPATSFGASGLPPELQVNPSTGLISGTCRTTGTFQVVIEADAARGAAKGTFTLVVNPAPLTSNSSPPSILIGDSFTYKITAAINPTSFTATGLPAGLTLDPNTGIISGTPSTTGNFSVTVTATSATAIASGIVSIHVLPPQITGPIGGVSLDLGSSFHSQITSTHNPTSFGANGLPPGFQIDSTTGVITGTAANPGNYSVSLQAHTSFGDALGNYQINILAPHLIQPSASGQVGSPFDFHLTATGNPTSFSMSGTLPAGLSFNGDTAEISGVPTLSGSYSVQVTVHTPYGDGSGSFFIFIARAPNFAPPPASIALNDTGFVIADPKRPRLYVAMSNGFAVIDTNTNSIIQRFSGYTVAGMAISPDQSTLYFTLPQYKDIFTLDLETLKSLSIPQLTHTPGQIAVGADGYFYITDQLANGFVYQIDPATGAEVHAFAPITRSSYSPLMIRATPDGRTLIVGELGRTSPTITKYTIDAGAAPTLAQQLDNISTGLLSDIAISADGSRAGFAFNNASNSAPITIRAVADLNVIAASTPASPPALDICFTPDEKFVLQRSSSELDTIGLPSGVIDSTIAGVSSPAPTYPSLAVDNTSSHVFVVAAQTINVYPVHGGSAAPAEKSLANVSTRVRTGTGDDVAIGGFIIEGNAPKTVLVRGMGPTLTTFHVPGVLADPTLELHAADGSIIASNDNWNEHRQDVLNTGKAPGDEHEAAIVATLDPGNYTAILRGVNATTGIALVEVYDVDPASASRVKNISTRGRVETGDNVMIGGFIVGGDQPTKVIVRAIGPSLTQYGVTGVLADPALDLYDANGNKFATNDSWSSDQQQQIIDSGYAPGDPREAAIVSTLQPGAYTAIVTGANNTTGVALVEIYNLENAP